MTEIVAIKKKCTDSQLANERDFPVPGRVRGLISEFGVVLAQKADTVRRAARTALEHLPGWANRAVTDLLGHIATLDQRIAEYDTAPVATRSRRRARQAADANSQRGTDDRDRYIRTLLILGARSVLTAASTKADRIGGWATAAKNARMIWAMLAKGEAFHPLPACCYALQLG